MPRTYRISPRPLFLVGAAILVIAVSAQLLTIVTNFSFLRANYSTTEIITYFLAVGAVLMVPIVEAVYDTNRLLRITGVVCFLYCSHITLAEQVYTTRHGKSTEIATLVSDVVNPKTARTLSLGIPILIAFLAIELLGRLSALGVEIMYSAHKQSRRIKMRRAI